MNIDNSKSAIIKDCDVSLSTCEVGLYVLSFVQFDNTSLKDFMIPHLDDSLLSNITRCVIQSSFDIYAHRDSLV